MFNIRSSSLTHVARLLRSLLHHSENLPIAIDMRLQAYLDSVDQALSSCLCTLKRSNQDLYEQLDTLRGLEPDFGSVQDLEVFREVKNTEFQIREWLMKEISLGLDIRDMLSMIQSERQGILYLT